MAVGFLPRTLAAVAVQLLYLAILPRLGFFSLLTGLWLPSLIALMLVYPPLEHTLDLEVKILAGPDKSMILFFSFLFLLHWCTKRAASENRAARFVAIRT